MDSGLCVSMRAAQGPASLKTKSTEWTLAPRRGAQVVRWSSAEVQDMKWAMVDDVGWLTGPIKMRRRLAGKSSGP
ncbi:hypothetical protein TYRP_005237 [Tyrophagus putrescentiae]|nr:hypothetical protein TYRP_005237 [Tyrophagus putrescentiae]